MDGVGLYLKFKDMLSSPDVYFWLEKGGDDKFLCSIPMSHLPVGGSPVPPRNLEAKGQWIQDAKGQISKIFLRHNNIIYRASWVISPFRLSLARSLSSSRAGVMELPGKDTLLNCNVLKSDPCHNVKFCLYLEMAWS